MSDINMYGKERPKLECDDYSVGKFVPVSFNSKFKWEIYKHDPVERLLLVCGKICETVDGEPLYIYIRSSYSFGQLKIHEDYFMKGTYLAETNDLEEAIYLAENIFIEYIENKKHITQMFWILLKKNKRN